MLNRPGCLREFIARGTSGVFYSLEFFRRSVGRGHPLRPKRTPLADQARWTILRRRVVRPRSFQRSHGDMHVRNTRWTDRDLLRAPRLVQAALRRAGSARDTLRARRRFLALVRSSRKPVTLLARVQPREPVGVPARAPASNLSHSELAATSRADQRSPRERPGLLSDGDLQSAPARRARAARPPISAGPRHQ